MEQVESTRQNLGGQGSSTQAMNIKSIVNFVVFYSEEQFGEIRPTAERTSKRSTRTSYINQLTDETGAFPKQNYKNILSAAY
jgi:hypothetical protein